MTYISSSFMFKVDLTSFLLQLRYKSNCVICHFIPALLYCLYQLQPLLSSTGEHSHIQVWRSNQVGPVFVGPISYYYCFVITKRVMTGSCPRRAWMRTTKWSGKMLLWNSSLTPQTLPKWVLEYTANTCMLNTNTSQCWTCFIICNIVLKVFFVDR